MSHLEANGHLRKRISILVAVALLLGSAYLAILGLSAPFSPSGWSEILALALLSIAFLMRKGRPRRFLAFAALGVFLIIFLIRLIAAGSGSMRLSTLPGGATSRWLSRLIDEQDVSLLGARALIHLWHLKGAERDGLVRAMHDAYVEMHQEQAVVASPVLDTLLERQSAAAFDAVIIEPKEAPRAGLIFLHGYAGNFTLECWLVAKAAQSIGAVTVCPSVGFSGHWLNHDGEETLRDTIEYLHARGIQKLFLAGLSNGGLGASGLAPRFAKELSGLIVISGSPSTGDGGGLPILIVQGEHDPNASAVTARGFAARTHATYQGYEGGHFVLMMRRLEVRKAIARWLLHEAKP